ncbi:ATP-binding protein [Listeria monocytogenes]|uniref:ATP-binding protein n=1 Tax=Listeria monocytogenes TaxID=1639 RepID=UPI000F28C605|nr:ATP-binding protein [Listeria monocytogenes]EAD0738608.1 ATP-binding protein [Listeria monocytogenes]MCN73787.1 ATP-binding protein [Listeria monocytogenes]TYU88945.1 ATP-binding protein [Listeria monocytogenes]
MNFELLKQVNPLSEVCPKHQIPLVQFRDQSPFCTKCKQEEMKEQEQKEVHAATERAYRWRTIEMLSRDSLLGDETLNGVRFQNYRTDNFETQKALEQAQLFASEYLTTFQHLHQLKKRWILAKENDRTDSKKVQLLEEEYRNFDRKTRFNVIFTGSPGVGKSHLAMSMLHEINVQANPHVSCLFISTVDLMRKVKDSFQNKESRYTEENMTRLLQRVDLLVLDDVGSESTLQRFNNDKDSQRMESSRYNQEFLYGILNARGRTILTTNLNSQEFKQLYNAKLVSRMFRGAEGKVIKFTEATGDKRTNLQF